MPTDTEILNAYHTIPADAVIPHDDLTGLFYDAVTDSGAALILYGDNGSAIFYIHSDEVIESIIAAIDNPVITFVDTGDTLMITVCAGADYYPANIYLNFSKSGKLHLEQMRKIRSDGAVAIHFIAFMYGELYKKDAISIGLPGEVLRHLPEP